MILAYTNSTAKTTDEYKKILDSQPVLSLIRNEIDERICSESGFRTCERIYKFALLPDSFTVGKELSGKQEIMRHRIVDIYKDEISTLFD